MIRLLVFCALLASVVPHCTRARKPWMHRPRHDYHHRHPGHHHHQEYDRIARDIANIDRRLADLCNNSTRVTYEQLHYKLAIPLEGYQNVTVVIKHRLLIATAVKDGDIYEEARLLPSTVDKKKGLMGFIDGTLEIQFPYVDASDDVDSCSELNYDMTPFVVPMLNATAEPDVDIDVRFGNVNIANTTAVNKEG